jgi:glycosyltransferase involved in cell wall biosynthesis
VGLVATLGRDVRWFIDLRDPWREDIRVYRSPVVVWMTRELRRRAFARCDGIIANTRSFAESLRRGYPETDVHWITNGIDLEGLPRHLPPPDDAVMIAYAGTLYSGRDFEPVLQAMQRLSAVGDGLPPVRLRFAGHTDPPHLARLYHQLQKHGIGQDQVEILGPIPMDDARAMAQRAHLALVLAQDQPLQVPAKLYELVGMGVPTLVLAEQGSASASEANRIGAAWKTPDDIEGIAAVIAEASGDSASAKRPPAERFDYEHISTRMAKILVPERDV